MNMNKMNINMNTRNIVQIRMQQIVLETANDNGLAFSCLLLLQVVIQISLSALNSHHQEATRRDALAI